MGTFYLLPKEGTFYKANLHCHTVVSDGDLTPEQVKEAYMGQAILLLLLRITTNTASMRS